MDTEPVIVAFLCNWCAYRAADLSGTMRMAHPADLRIIRVMCSGRVEPRFVLKAFKEGADGVLVGGCPVGQCHYQQGNARAQVRTRLLQKLLPQLGIDPVRCRLVLVSATEGTAFVEAVEEMRRELLAIKKAEGIQGKGMEPFPPTASEAAIRNNP